MEFLDRHPEASIFHTPEWLDALRQTYGYQPVAFTTSKGAELSNGLVFCEVKSWLTGKRLVSVPFSDHCQPLASGADLNVIMESLQSARGTERWKYIEVRPLCDEAMRGLGGLGVNGENFSFHKIDLRPVVNTIYRGFHDSCVRRKIKRAEREKLTYETGRSEDLLKKFRHLMLLTRRRHKLPPQPAAWFSNLAKCLGEHLTIHVLSNGSTPIASILTLSYKKSLMYKYGCSDARFHNLGGTPLLFWKAIQQGKEAGAEEFDLGRSGYEDPGLIEFKERLGGVASELRYYQSPAPRAKKAPTKASTSWARTALSKLPDPLLAGVGQFLYRHIG
jgi:hypothetical protein